MTGSEASHERRQVTRQTPIRDSSIRVLSLVPDPSCFYRQQRELLEQNHVDFDTLCVPGARQYSETDVEERTAVDYARFYAQTVRASFGPHDLVHANYGLTAPGAVVQPNLPVVLSLWGSDLLGRFSSLSKWCARQADAVIVMSPEMAVALDRDCYVIPHGVDMGLFSPEPTESARREVGWSSDAQHVLFPYAPTKEMKDYPRAKRVVERANDRYSDSIELHTVFGKTHEQIPTYMNAADVLLLTSKSEGSPNTVKEALACNLPVVSTDVGDVSVRLEGLPLSTVCDRDVGLVTSLVDVLESDAETDTRRAVWDVSLSRTTERVKAVYAEVLDRET